ncbi:MAG TPA: hypothetical protein DD979_10080 [Gammaproteobacteria bacterium]|nr:hypothetical protein [Gammaproteobacteria bacterium]
MLKIVMICSHVALHLLNQYSFNPSMVSMFYMADLRPWYAIFSFYLAIKLFIKINVLKDAHKCIERICRYVSEVLQFSGCAVKIVSNCELFEKILAVA